MKIQHTILINDKKIQVQYKNKIQDWINNNQDINWRETKSIMCDTAAEVLGYQRKNNKKQTIENNPIIEQLSRIQKEYRIKIENSSNIEEVKKFRNIEIKLWNLQSHTHVKKVGHTSKFPFGIYWWTWKTNSY